RRRPRGGSQHGGAGDGAVGGDGVGALVEAAQGGGERAGVLRGLGEEGAGGAGAGHDGAEGSGGAAGVEDRGQPGTQGQGRRLQVVGERRAEPAGVSGGERGRQAGVQAGFGGVRAQPVVLGEHRRGGQAALGQGEDPVERAGGRQRGQELASPGADGGVAEQREGHVAAEVGGEV